MEKTFSDFKRDLIARDASYSKASEVHLRKLFEEHHWRAPGSVKVGEDKAIAAVLLTTETVPPFEVEDRIDVVTAECVFGMNFFRDLFAVGRDIFGGRSDATQKVLRDARTTVLHELRREAYLLGANGVIGVDLDYSEMSGGGKSMLFVVASGTAVVFKDRPVAKQTTVNLKGAKPSPASDWDEIV